MTTAAIILLALIVGLLILHVNAMQRRLTILTLRNATLIAELAKETSETLKAHGALFIAQGEVNSEVLKAFKGQAGEGPHRTAKPDLRLVPRDEDATA